MPLRTLARLAPLFLVLAFGPCGDGTTERPAAAATASGSGGGDARGEVTFELDGRRVRSDDYVAVWSRGMTPEMLTLTVFFDRDRYRKLPPTVDLVVYSPVGPEQPFFSQREHKITSGRQVFSLALADHKDRMGNLDETSFADLYDGGSARVRLTAFDTLGTSVSGSFEGTLANANGRTVRITNGELRGVRYVVRRYDQ